MRDRTKGEKMMALLGMIEYERHELDAYAYARLRWWCPLVWIYTPVVAAGVFFLEGFKASAQTVINLFRF